MIVTLNDIRIYGSVCISSLRQSRLKTQSHQVSIRASKAKPKHKKCAMNTFIYVSARERSKLRQCTSFEVLKLTNELGGRWNWVSFPLASALSSLRKSVQQGTGKSRSTGSQKLENRAISRQWPAGNIALWPRSLFRHPPQGSQIGRASSGQGSWWVAKMLWFTWQHF